MMTKVPGTTDEPDPYTLNEEQITGALQLEVDRWGKDGYNPEGISHSLFKMDVVLTSLIEYIKTILPDFNEEDFILECNRRTLKKLQEFRAIYKAQAARSQILDGVHMDIPKDILGPNGKTI